MNIYRALLLSIFISLSLEVSAQPGGGRPCPRPPCPPPTVPITGIEYLIGLGGLYGFKKLIDRSRAKK